MKQTHYWTCDPVCGRIEQREFLQDEEIVLDYGDFGRFLVQGRGYMVAGFPSKQQAVLWGLNWIDEHVASYRDIRKLLEQAL